jgi:membrane-associated phospholipid phosphatase
MAELREVMDVKDNLTEGQAQTAIFWDDGPGTYSPAGHWTDIALDLTKNHGLGTKQAARVFAYLGVAEADAAIAVFESKYHWWSIRPVTVVRRLCENGARLCTKEELAADPSLATYPSWDPFIVTPPFPSYPGGHSTFSGAAGAVLAYFFPNNADLVNQWAEEAAMSRLYGGIHFRSDNDAGLVLGRSVASLATTRAESDGSGL